MCNLLHITTFSYKNSGTKRKHLEHFPQCSCVQIENIITVKRAYKPLVQFKDSSWNGCVQLSACVYELWTGHSLGTLFTGKTTQIQRHIPNMKPSLPISSTFFVANLELCDLIFQITTPTAVRLDKDIATFNSYKLILSSHSVVSWPPHPFTTWTIMH